MLLDEPDAHLHVILQKQIYDRLRLITLRAIRVGPLFAEAAQQYLVDKLSPATYRDPHADDDYLTCTPASKTLLPELFATASVNIKKAEFYLIAEQMRADEIHPEVKTILNDIAKKLGILQGSEHSCEKRSNSRA